MKNKIIILNGTSSAGKTSIVKEFQNLAKECYYRMRMDTIYNILPERYLIYRNHNEFCPELPNKLTDENRKGFYFEGEKKCKLGEYAKCMSLDFIDLILTLSNNGRNIIVDMITFGTSELGYMADIFQKFDVYLVRVYCNPKELENREKKRGDRIVGSGEYGQKFIDAKYNDLVLDSTDKSPKELAEELYNFIHTNSPKALKKLHKDNAITLKVDDNIELETKALKHAKKLAQIIEKNKKFFKTRMGWIPEKKYTEFDAKSYIKNTTYGQDFIKDFVIKYNNKVVGVINFQDLKNNEADIGYWLSEDAQGKGIMTKACKRLLEYGFKNLNFEKINLYCSITNTKSENIAKRLNMKFECIMPNFENLYGNMIDHKKYTISKNDFL